jgi:hypothetical protein
VVVEQRNRVDDLDTIVTGTANENPVDGGSFVLERVEY